MADQQFDYDLITLGAGSGGVRASRFSAQLYGAKVAVVELPFGFVSTDDIGGAGGTWVRPHPRLHPEIFTMHSMLAMAPHTHPSPTS